MKISWLFLIIGVLSIGATSYQNETLPVTYYVHPVLGDDDNQGTNPLAPLQTLAKASTIKLRPGDAILLAAGQQFGGSLVLQGQRGTAEQPIKIGSYQQGNNLKDARAIIEVSTSVHGIELVDCSHISVGQLIIQSKGGVAPSTAKMRCGVLVTTSQIGLYQSISLEELLIRDIFIESPGFRRGSSEVRTANGTQRYGWGIRVLNPVPEAILKDISIRNCVVENVAHTGIKFTGSKTTASSSQKHNILNIILTGNRVLRTGGPGIQMSRIGFGHISKNFVDQSGSNDDSRKWGRGSGLWTWGSADVLIERNHFMNANGPGDSAGCHIDFNCNDVVVQYNFSANNAGGFCEILGNNYNCAYRYNISVNDGHRVKGESGAFQDGKTFWLSGYAGNGKPRTGPFNSYFYNNTIYVGKEIQSKIAVDKNASGILVANNIFCVEGAGKMVLGDQYKPEQSGGGVGKNVFFENNLYLHEAYWPADVWIQDKNKLLGDPQFTRKGGTKIEDYIARDVSLIKNSGIEIPMIPQDSIGLKIGLHPAFDILGNPIVGKPDLGAIELGN